MKQIVTVLMTAILFQGGVDLAAQEKLQGKLSGENVKTGIQVYEYVREQYGQKKAIGTITEKIESVGENMIITYKQDLPQVVIVDSLVVDFKSFIPKSYRSDFFTRQNITVRYNGSESVDVWIKRRSFGVNQDTSYTTEFDQLRHDSHWLPTLVYAVGKEDKTSWDIPVYSYNNQEDVVKIKLLNEEKIMLHDKTYDTVKYEVSRENSENIYHYWIGKKSRRMLQTRGEINPNLVVWLRVKSQV